MNNKIYYAVNFKAPSIWFWSLIALAITIVASYFAYVLFRDGEWKVAIFILPFTLFFPYILISGIKSRIILTTDSIIKKTIFKKNEIKFCDIKKITRYEQFPGGNGSISFFEIDETKPNKNIFFSPVNVIYISDSENSRIDKFSKSNRLSFHETSDIYLILKEKIDAEINSA